MSERPEPQREAAQLPIVAEIGDELHRRHRRREQIRRRVGAAIGVAALGAVGVVAAIGTGPASRATPPAGERQRAILAGSSHDTAWRLVADRSRGRDCLRIVVRSAATSRCERATTAPGSGISAAPVTTGDHGFVYGVTSQRVQRVAVRLDDGRCATVRTHPVALASAATAASRLRVYVAAFRRPIVPRAPARPAHGRNPDAIIRVPKGILRFPGGRASEGTCATAQ